MRKLIQKLALTTLLITSTTIPTLAAEASFSDINNSYAKDAILQLAEVGIINGKGQGKFDPTGKITRQEFSVILAKALNLDVSNSPLEPTFSDVHTDHWSFKYVEAAAKAGLINGIGEGTFGNGQILSRQEMATLFVRALGVDATGYADTLTFSDTGNIASYAKDAVGYVVEAGLMNGYPNNTFDPTGVADRQAVALVTSKFLKVQEDVTPKPVPEPSPNPEPTPTPVPQPAPQPVPSPTPDRDRDDDDDRPGNHAPIVNKTIENVAGIVGDIKTVDISDAFTDADGDKLDIIFTISDQSVASITRDGALYVTLLKEGTATVTLTAKDRKGKVAYQEFTVTVKQNHVPIVIGTIEDQSIKLGNDPVVIDLTKVFNDVDGDNLKFSTSLSPVLNNLVESNNVKLEINGNTLIITPLLIGTSKVTVKAMDGRGGNVSESFNVSVSGPAGPVAPPTFTPMTTQTNGLPHVRHNYDLNYGNAVREIILKRDGESPVSYTVSANQVQSTGSDIVLLGHGTYLVPGTYEWTIKATGYEDAIVFVSVTSPLQPPNNAPSVKNAITDQNVQLGAGDNTVDISETFDDTDGDILDLSAKSDDETIATVSVSGRNLVITPVSQGTTTVTVTASDGKGGTAQDIFSLTIAPNEATMTLAYSDNPSVQVTSLIEGEQPWKHFILTLNGDAFTLGFNPLDDIEFDGDLAGLAMSSFLKNGTTKILLEHVHGTILRNTGEGTITIKGRALLSGEDLTLTVNVIPSIN